MDYKESIVRFLINPFHATDLFLYPLKRFSGGHRKRPVASNGLKDLNFLPSCKIYKSISFVDTCIGETIRNV